MINWKRLHTIISFVLKKPVHITLTTHKFMDGKITISAVVFNSEEVEILLNAYHCDCIDIIIKALAHEAVHVLNGNPEHGTEFERKWEALGKWIFNEYSLPSSPKLRREELIRRMDLKGNGLDITSYDIINNKKYNENILCPFCKAKTMEIYFDEEDNMKLFTCRNGHSFISDGKSVCKKSALKSVSIN